MSSGNFAGSRPDPFSYFTNLFKGRWETSFGAKTVSTKQDKVTGETTGVIIVAGQSNACNIVGSATPYAPTNPTKIDHMFVDNGGVYVASDPLLGCETAGLGIRNLFLQLADKLITAGWRQRVVLVAVGIGSTSAQQWQDELYRRIINANERAKAKGYSVDCITWQQGESDNILSTSQATYVANMQAVFAQVQREGVTAPWILAKGTYYNGNPYAPVRAAIDQLVNGSTVFLGPDTDALTGLTYRNVDLTHFNNTGADAAASLWVPKVQAAAP